MTWSYDPSDFDTTTASGRLNSVRVLIGDTDTTSQQIQNEEINFALAQNNNNTYYGASFAARLIASKYMRLVDTRLDDNALTANYSGLHNHYNLLADQLAQLGKKVSGTSLGVSAGGISLTEMDLVDTNTDRPSGFKKDQFKFDGSGYKYIPDYYRW